MTNGSYEIVNEFPPNYEAIVKRFPEVAGQKFLVFTYGNKIYNPNPAGNELPPYLIVHELVHVKQQESIGPDEWWRAYLADDQFRLAQEIPAYRAEYKHFCKLNKDRNQRHGFLNFQAYNLSGASYGNIITKETAIARISGYL